MAVASVSISKAESMNRAARQEISDENVKEGERIRMMLSCNTRIVMYHGDQRGGERLRLAMTTQ